MPILAAFLFVSLITGFWDAVSIILPSSILHQCVYTVHCDLVPMRFIHVACSIDIIDYVTIPYLTYLRYSNWWPSRVEANRWRSQSDYWQQCYFVSVAWSLLKERWCMSSPISSYWSAIDYVVYYLWFAEAVCDLLEWNNGMEQLSGLLECYALK